MGYVSSVILTLHGEPALKKCFFFFSWPFPRHPCTIYTNNNITLVQNTLQFCGTKWQVPFWNNNPLCMIQYRHLTFNWNMRFIIKWLYSNICHKPDCLSLCLFRYSLFFMTNGALRDINTTCLFTMVRAGFSILLCMHTIPRYVHIATIMSLLTIHSWIKNETQSRGWNKWMLQNQLFPLHICKILGWDSRFFLRGF